MEKWKRQNEWGMTEKADYSDREIERRREFQCAIFIEHIGAHEKLEQQPPYT